MLRIVPLGGLHEIGKNMTVIEYGDDIIIIDCGMAFPDNEMLGVDVVIPDFSYLRDNSYKIRGMLITHPHEDHIGAIPYLLQEFDMPVYASKLACGFIKYKLDEHKMSSYNLQEIGPGEVMRIGCFRIETVHMTHSVADSMAFAIDTPVGKIFYTGDFKLDLTPINEEPVDIGKLAHIGDEGVLLLLADSTNANRKGYSVSERAVGISLENIFKDNKCRIICATFSSNVHRLQKIIDLGIQNGRKIAVAGRSIENSVSISTQLGYMNIPAESLIDIKQIKNYNDNELLIITTGTQGEPMSALTRMATGEHRQVKIRPGDCVILSSSVVPGNEKTISNVQNQLLEKGAEVIYSEIADVHASGHACREELKILQSLLKPMFFMPIHGEYRHLTGHAGIAQEMGIPDKNIFVCTNGSVVELGPEKGMLLPDKVPASGIMVDGLGVGDVGTVVLNERRGLAEAGLISVTVVYDAASGQLLAGPELHTRGFTYVKEYGKLLSEIREATEIALDRAEAEHITEIPELRLFLRNELRNYIYETMNRNPVILPIVIKI